MKKLRSVSLKMTDNAYALAKETADEKDMSLPEWIEDLITAESEDDSLTSEEIIDMDWDEKIDVIDEYGLEVDPDDYDDDTEGEFTEAIIDELELDYPDNPGGLIWLLVAVVLGLFGWGLIRKSNQPA